jgi:hypothetical protein
MDMLKQLQIPVLIFSALCAGAALAECLPPEEVTVPDGAKASEEELTKGQEVIRKFMMANESYRQCLDKDLAALGDAATDEQKALNTQLFNSSVDREQALVEKYNQQVRAFNEANP